VLAVGVVGVALCCALPSLLAGGALVAVAGWGWGVWAAIGVAAVVVTSAWWFRRQRHRPGTQQIDPATESVPAPGVPTWAQAEARIAE
jgi:O-antigen/teichoic acid export membrane protein